MTNSRNTILFGTFARMAAYIVVVNGAVTPRTVHAAMGAVYPFPVRDT